MPLPSPQETGWVPSYLLNRYGTRQPGTYQPTEADIMTLMGEQVTGTNLDTASTQNADNVAYWQNLWREQFNSPGALDTSLGSPLSAALVAMGGAAAGGAFANGGAGYGAAQTFPYSAGGTVTGSAIPGVTSATTAANAAAAGIGPIAGTGAGAVNALDQSTQGPPLPNGGGVAAGSAGAAAGLNWATLVPSLVSGVTGVLGADAQADASGDALALSERMFNQTREDALPRIQTGNRAVGVLDDYLGLTTGTPNMGRFFESPSYQYNLAETTRAGERALGSMGLRQSGPMVREAQRNASGLASRESGSFVDQLLAAAGLGTTGAAASAAAGSANAAYGGAAIQNRGAARSSGYGAINDSVQGGINNHLLQQYLQRNPVYA